jgi:hypothetical protein
MRRDETMSAGQVFEGTWEEVSRQAERLAGKRVRLAVIENGQADLDEGKLPFYATASPEERARAWEEWCSLPRPRVPPLSDEAISRESIYSPERG